MSYSLQKLVEELGRALGHTLHQSPWYQQAFYHSSYVNEHLDKGLQSNERLEFLGDAVVELAVSEYLFQRFMGSREGQLTRLRAAVVCTPALARRARELDLGKWLYLGRGELGSGGRDRESILADTFESLIGAIYLSEGWQTAYNVVKEQLEKEIEHVLQEGAHDYKTLLQEMAQARGMNIRYRLLEERGPDHNKVFIMAVEANGQQLAVGEGRNKKESEQQAARLALKEIEKRKVWSPKKVKGSGNRMVLESFDQGGVR